MGDSHFTVALLPELPKKRKAQIQDLTKAELQCLRALDAAIRQHGNPSLKEIASCYVNVCVSTSICYPSMVHRYLRRLEAKGWVRLEPRRTRGVRMLRDLPADEGA